MKSLLSALIVGFVFAIGLCVAGMTQTQKIIGFLDVFGNWDASLLFVMIGAISVHFVGYRLILRQKTPVFSNQWYIPENKEITPALIFGSILFGIGWALGGYCPGPAIVSLASWQQAPIVLVSGMLAGMILFRVINHKLKLKL